MRSILLVRLVAVSTIGAIAAVGYLASDMLVWAPTRTYDLRVAELVLDLQSLHEREAAARTELAELAASRRPTGSHELVMVAASATASSASLQERVRNSIARVGGTSIASQASVQESSGSAKISILIRARFTENGILSFVRELELSKPPVFFESFEMQPVRGPDGTSVLEFTGVLSGFHSDAN